MKKRLLIGMALLILAAVLALLAPLGWEEIKLWRQKPESAQIHDLGKSFCEGELTSGCRREAAEALGDDVALIVELDGFDFHTLEQARPGLITQSLYSRQQILRLDSSTFESFTPDFAYSIEKEGLTFFVYHLSGAGDVSVEWRRDGISYSLDISWKRPNDAPVNRKTLRKVLDSIQYETPETKE